MSGVPDISRERYDAVLFDLDGVLTSTASLHARAWKETFDPVLDEHAPEQPPFDADHDYERHVDGKPREDGVRDFLASREIHPPEGGPDDAPDAFTVGGIGQRKQALVERELAKGGIEAYSGSVRWVEQLRKRGIRTAVVSSSANAVAVLEACGIRELFEEVVDGNVVTELHLHGKPAPDQFLEGARRLGAPAERTVVVEDALAGVAAGRAGRFGLVLGVARNAQPEELLASGADVVVGDLSELVT
ncbi:MAG: HAD family hydrolase [Solirubrobacteraceae bacterium]